MINDHELSGLKLQKPINKLSLVPDNHIDIMKHYNLVVTGRVQRVGFRFSAMEAAYRFSIHGFVMNSGRNDVFIEAEGTVDNLGLFIAWCRKGPVGASVENVDVEEAPMKNFTRFEIMSRTEVL